jgi:WD40 repeat protein/serine/threonine protein kinase
VPDAPRGPAPTLPEEAGPARTLPEAPEPAPEAEWRVGQVVLGLYEVTGVLGQGGMGRVYRVRHRGWGVDLAVKVPLAKALAAAGGAEAFEREAETWVNLGLHPHTVSCYYVRRVDGIPRVFAEYLDGGSLAQAIRARRLADAASILDVAIQFAWGLHYAHEQGLVHRDVKPGNVMLTADGVVKVTDFGLAGARVAPAAVGGAGDQTTMAPGGGGGTPPYMSPEQWSGRPLTRRTDVWSWALSALEMFAGHRTWEAGPAGLEILDLLLGADDSLAVAMPPPVADLLRRCFEPEPERRPRTLADAADALVAAYQEAAGRPYPRARPEGGRETADSLNNRAVSLLDLGRAGAERFWEQALAAEPQHLEASYNSAVFAWSRGRLPDEELLARVTEARRASSQAARAEELLSHARHGVGEYRHAAGAGGRAGGGLEIALTLKGLAEAASALAVTRDGGFVLASRGGEVRVWRGSGEAVHALVPPELQVRAMATTPDGHAVLLAGDGAPQLWEIAGARPLRGYPRLPGITTCVALSEDGQWAVAGSTDRTLRVWELAGGPPRPALEGHTEAVSCVALGPDGLAVSGGLDGTVRVWDLGKGALSATFVAHRGKVHSVAVSADGSRIFSAGEDRCLREWDLAAAACSRTLLGPGAAATSVVLSPDGSRAVATSLDRSVRVFDLRTALVRGVARLEAPVTTAAAAAKDLASVWVSSGHVIHELRLGPARRPPYALSRPVSVVEVEHRVAAFAKRVQDARLSLTRGDLGRALTLAREARTIPGHERSAEALTLWDDVTAHLPRKGLEAAWEAASLEGHRDPVVCVATSADGTHALSGDIAGTLRWWDLARRAADGTVAAHDLTIAAVALTPDGRHAVSASWDRTVKVWDGPGQDARVLEGHGDYVNGLALSPSGRTILSASSDQTLRLWDLASGRVLGVLEGHDAPVSSCAFGPDARFALSGGWDSTVRLWDVQSRSAAGVLHGHDTSVGAVAVSPDGLQAASAGLDGAVRLWDLRARRLLRLLSGHTAEVTTVAFLPDGLHLVTASRDKSLQLWDAASGRCLRSLTHTGAVLSAVPLPSGNAVLCGGTDLALKLWRLDWQADAAAATIRPAAMRETLRHETIRIAEAPAASAWDEIQRAAPRAAAREAAVDVVRRARRRLPRGRAIALAATIVAAVAGAIALLRPRTVELGFSHHQSELARKEAAVVDLSQRGGSCADGGYEQYFERARERIVSEETLGCLLRLQQPGLAEYYLRDVSLDDEERMVEARKRRNAAALLAALGDPAVPALCQALATGPEPQRGVAIRALAAQANDAARACITGALGHADPAVRAEALTGLRLLVGHAAVSATDLRALAEPLTRDPVPAVRLASTSVLALFDFEHSQAMLAAMESDADPEVASAVRGLRTALKRHRDLNPDRAY